MIYDLQKASIFKRISAYLFDGVLTVTLAVFLACVISIITGYDGYNNELTELYTKYEDEYGIKFNVAYEEYDTMTEEQLEVYNTAYKAMTSDEAFSYTYGMVINLTLLILSLSLLIAILISEFVVPLFLKNGQTLGKKIFSIGLMRTDGVKINDIMLLIRSLLGKYAIETMVPVLIVIMIYFNSIGIIGGVILLLLFILQAVCFFISGTYSLIHDLLAKTVVVDMATQMIFDTEEQMIKYKAEAAAAQAERARETY